VRPQIDARDATFGRVAVKVGRK